MAAPDRILVFGAGALGCYFSAMLTRSGADVTLIARGETLHNVARDGVVIEGLSGDFTVRPALVTDSVPADAPQLVLLATKAWQVVEAVQSLQASLPADSKVLTLQNGVEAPEQVADQLGVSRTLAGVCRVSCASLRPGHVRHSGISPSITLGEMAGGNPSNLANRLSAALTKANISVAIIDDPIKELWKKLLFISALAGAGAVCRVPVGDIRAHPESNALLHDLLHEAAVIANACGVSVDQDEVGTVWDFLMHLPGETEASMQRDIIEGRPSELDAIVGVLVRRADAKGVRAPALHYVYGSLAPQESHARRREA